MEKLNVCLINDSFPPAIDGVANAVTNYAQIIARDYGAPTVVTPYYPDADDSVYPFPVVRYPSVDMTKLVGYRAGMPFSPEIATKLEKAHFDIIHSHCPITSTMLARSVRARLDVPLVFTYHTKFDIDIANAIRSKRLQEEAAKILVENISACDEVWTVSNGAGENLRKLGYLLGDMFDIGLDPAVDEPFAITGIRILDDGRLELAFNGVREDLGEAARDELYPVYRMETIGGDESPVGGTTEIVELGGVKRTVWTSEEPIDEARGFYRVKVNSPR